MAKYDEIWESLKAHKSVVLSIHPRLQKRVIKGVIHAKDHDLLFKFAALEACKRYVIDYIAESARVTVVLKEYERVKELSLEDF